MYNTPFHNKSLSNFKFLVTGGAGFIGSNLVEYLVKYNAKKIVIFDNFSTGKRKNIEPFLSNPSVELIEGDIRDLETCKKSVKNIDYVFHQAALGSVPRSIENPILTNSVNISGFLNMLVATQHENQVKRFIYAASSSTYGDHKRLPKIESQIGNPLSPYAVTKYVNELYTDVFHRIYNLETIGLRYFNVFGPKQDPEGPYAAVIPKFINQFLNGNDITINGDGKHSRDFTFVENVVQANIKAAFTTSKNAINQVYNVACGENINLNQLVEILKKCFTNLNKTTTNTKVIYGPERQGDVKHSLASIEKAKKKLNYKPIIPFREGIKKTVLSQYE